MSLYRWLTSRNREIGVGDAGDGLIEDSAEPLFALAGQIPPACAWTSNTEPTKPRKLPSSSKLGLAASMHNGTAVGSPETVIERKRFVAFVRFEEDASGFLAVVRVNRVQPTESELFNALSSVFVPPAREEGRGAAGR